MEIIENTLSNIYYNTTHPASYGSAKNLYEYAKNENPNITFEDVIQWLKKQISYTLHRPARKNFPRNKIFVTHINEQWQCDLVDMQEFSKDNNGYKYILTIIDCLSKYLRAVSLKSKHSSVIINEFKEIFKEIKPLKLQSDQGTEFKNKPFITFCKKEEVRYFTSKDKKIKCSIVERVNRTLKEKMFRYFTANGTRKYIDVLQELVDSYNNRCHRSIKMKPIDVNELNEKIAYKNLYGKNTLKHIYSKKSKKEDHLNVGKTVRRKYDLSVFDRGYYPYWTDQTYSITDKLNKVGKYQYIIKDYKGEKSNRRYYGEELQAVSDQTAYRVEKVLKKRKRNNKLEYFVKWMNYPSTQNSWISAENLFRMNRTS
jgi:hypothetical protein